MTAKPNRTSPKEAKCLVCDCTDSAACQPACWWIVVNRGKGVGVCSSCSKRLGAIHKNFPTFFSAHYWRS